LPNQNLPAARENSALPEDYSVEECVESSAASKAASFFMGVINSDWFSQGLGLIDSVEARRRRRRLTMIIAQFTIESTLHTSLYRGDLRRRPSGRVGR
jgi:hypothetical protein